MEIAEKGYIPEGQKDLSLRVVVIHNTANMSSEEKICKWAQKPVKFPTPPTLLSG
jgi:hypothetical protein